MLLHLDADAFYASVEQVENPALRGKAMAVGGLHRGIIASATYEARARGVYTPMPTTRALRICPQNHRTHDGGATRRDNLELV